MLENLVQQMQDFFSDVTLAYLMLVNGVGLILMAWDKIMAKLGKKRIPEKFLLAVAALGGSLGTWLGMQIFRHKTRHAQFALGIPLIFLLQAGAVIFLMYYL